MILQAAGAIEMFDHRLSQIREKSRHSDSFKTNIAACSYDSVGSVSCLNGWNTFKEQWRAQPASWYPRNVFRLVRVDAVNHIGRQQNEAVLSNSNYFFSAETQEARSREAIVHTRGGTRLKRYLMT